MKRIVGLALLLLVSLAAFQPNAVQACPNCKFANESDPDDPDAQQVDNRRPQAYMYSILFMLAVPATVFTGFGIGLYRLSQRNEPLDLPQDGDVADSQTR